MPNILVSELKPKGFITLTDPQTGQVVKVIAPAGLELGIDDPAWPGEGLKLPSKAAPAYVTNKLYNENGVLKFSGVTIVSGSTPAPSAGGWTDGGTDVYLTTSTDSVGMGTSSPSTNLHIASTGDAAIYLEAEYR